jgi:hypothetical protein
MRAKTNFNYTRLNLILLMKDIEEDIKFNSLPEQLALDSRRILFNHFKLDKDIVGNDGAQKRFNEKRRQIKGSRKNNSE